MIAEKEADPKGNRFWTTITEPRIYPITVDEVKEFARIDGEDEDTLLESFIASVVPLMEGYLRRALINRTIRMIMDEWNSREIELPYPPLVSVTSITTIDEDDTETTYSSDNYYVITEGIPGRITIKKGVSLPTNTARLSGGFRITYVAGYGTSRDDIPQAIRTGIMQWVTEIYETRGMVDNEMFHNEPPPDVKKSVMNFRVERVR